MPNNLQFIRELQQKINRKKINFPSKALNLTKTKKGKQLKSGNWIKQTKQSDKKTKKKKKLKKAELDGWTACSSFHIYKNLSPRQVKAFVLSPFTCASLWAAFYSQFQFQLQNSFFWIQAKSQIHVQAQSSG